MIGIRPDFAGDEVPQGGTAKFSRHRVGRRRQAQGDPRRALEARQDRAELPVVPLRQLLELRAGDLHRGGRQRHDRHRRRRRGFDLAARRLGPLPPGDRDARSGRPGHQLRVRRRLVRRGELDRDARRARNRARQGGLCARRSGEAEDLAALRRRACWSPSAPRSCSPPSPRPCPKAARPSTFRSAPTGAPAPMSRPRSSGRARRRNRACPPAPSA